jgi:hypothetical protein
MRNASRYAVVIACLIAAMPFIGNTAEGAHQFVLSPEGNNLWAYDATTGAAQVVNVAQNGTAPAGMPAPLNPAKRDINGQICVSPDGSHIITGEDTVIGGSSHDPRIAGWGYFAIQGAQIGQLRIDQQGKLAPESAGGPGYTGDPDNFGCGFLDDNRLVTSAIGNTLPGEDANGQLFLWFGPFDQGFRTETVGSTGFFVGEVPHCQIDDTLATAGGIAVDSNGDVYVATNRPDDDFNAGSVWRYRGEWPSSPAECNQAYLTTHITREQIIPIVAAPLDPRAVTPSAVAISPQDTLYVSSVFTGTVSEFSKDGLWMRDIFPVSPVAPPTGPTGDTPFGLAFTADGSLWIADLGIVLNAPVSGQGSVIKVSFLNGIPLPLGERINEGITFPDGLGVYTPAG